MGGLKKCYQKMFINSIDAAVFVVTNSLSFYCGGDSNKMAADNHIYCTDDNSQV